MSNSYQGTKAIRKSSTITLDVRGKTGPLLITQGEQKMYDTEG